MKAIGFILALTFGISAWSLTEAELQKRLSAKTSAWSETRDRMTKDLQLKTEQAATMDRSIEDCKKKTRNCEPPELQAYQANASRLKGETASMNEALRRADADNTKFQEQSLADIKQARDLSVIQQKEATVETILKTQGIGLDINRLRANVTDQRAVLLEIEKKIDREAMGIYMQNKMFALLNSQVICEANNRCNAPEKKTVDIKGLKEIFPALDPKEVLSADELHYRAVKQKKSSGTP